MVKDKTDPKGGRHQHYQLYWKGVFVEGAHLSLHSRNGHVKTAHARIIENLDIAVNNPIAELLALGTALTDQKLAVASFVGNLPKGELVLTNPNGDYLKGNYRLAWYFDILNGATSSVNRVYVDATSGQVISRYSLSSSCFKSDPSVLSKTHKPVVGSGLLNAPMGAGTFNSLYPRGNPTPSFEVEPYLQGGTGSTQLTMSTNVNQALRTRRDLNNNGNWNDDPDLTNSTMNWGNNERNATLAHWVVYRSYQYFLNRFGINGTDGQGGIGEIFIVPSFNGADWTYATRRLRIGTIGGTILSSVDIVGHEFGHGVSNLLVAGWMPSRSNREVGALNEGFSDIIGTAMERELLPTGGPNERWNWKIGEDAVYLRNMQHPHDVSDGISGQPEKYQEAGFWDFNDEPHHNNGVLNKWFNTLVDGTGPNGNITPISSFDDAMSVVYWALDYYIYGDYNYPNAANALRAAARQVFGECSPQQNAVIAALRAVNLPVGDCSPDCNYQAVNMSPGTANCNQGITLSAGCTSGPGNTNGWTCQGITYTFSGPNVPLGSGPNSSVNIITPSASGNYGYSLALSKPNSGCYARYINFNIDVSCGTPPPPPPPGADCQSFAETCSGNDQEIRSVILNVATAGNYPLTITYKSVEKPVDALVRVGNATTSVHYNQTTTYTTATTGSVFLNQGANTIGLSSGTGGGYVCFTNICTGTGGGNPPTPNCDFNTSVNSANASCNQTGVQLTASCNGANCDGLSYSWDGGQSGQTASFNAGGSNGSTNYSVTVARSGCSNKTATGTINVSGCGGGNPPAGACQSFGAVCSGNGQEVQYVSLNVATAGSYPLTITYTSHEKAVDAIVRVGSTTTPIHYNQTTYGAYTTATTGSVYLAQGANTIGLSSGSDGGYVCFNNICAGSGSGRVGASDAGMESDGLTLQLYPNPNAGQFQARMVTVQGRRYSLEVTNLLGKSLHKREFMGKGGVQTETIELANTPTGIVLVSVQSGDKRVSKTLLIQR